MLLLKSFEFCLWNVIVLSEKLGDTSRIMHFVHHLPYLSFQYWFFFSLWGKESFTTVFNMLSRTSLLSFQKLSMQFSSSLIGEYIGPSLFRQNKVGYDGTTHLLHRTLLPIRKETKEPLRIKILLLHFLSVLFRWNLETNRGWTLIRSKDSQTSSQNQPIHKLSCCLMKKARKILWNWKLKTLKCIQQKLRKSSSSNLLLFFVLL